MNSKSQRLFQTERGFTLLELLVAVFISALILTLVGTSFFQIINAKEKVEDQLELIHEARVVFSRIGKDLSSVYPRGKVVNSAASYPYIFFLATNDEQTDNSRLEFSSFARSPIEFNRESDQSEITYFMVRIEDEEKYDEENQIFALIRKENPWFGNDQGGTQYPISERVKKFKLTYQNAKKVDDPLIEQVDIEEWDAVLLGGTLPKAVAVELVLTDDEGLDHTFNTLIIMPIAK